MGKGFKEKVSNVHPVYSTIIGSAQETQHTQEVQEAPQAPVQSMPSVGSTQGRKGAKLPRINMAFSPQGLEYLRVMSALCGVSVTRYVNDLVERDMDQNSELYHIAKGLTHSI